MEGKSNTGLYIGLGVVGVLGIVITIVLVSSKKTDQQYYANQGLYPPGYNPALYPPGYVPTAQQQSDKAALYTAGASVVNSVLTTFFAPKAAQSSTPNYRDDSGVMMYTDHG
jgi:hypothetical protein